MAIAMGLGPGSKVSIFPHAAPLKPSRNYPATVDRRTLTAVLVGAIVALLFAAVATSGAVPLADGPPRFLGDIEATPNVIEVEIESAPAEEAEREEQEPSPLIEAIVRTVFYAILVVGAVLAGALLWRHRPSFAWRRRRRRTDHDIDVLADVAAAITADAARSRRPCAAGGRAAPSSSAGCVSKQPSPKPAWSELRPTPRASSPSGCWRRTPSTLGRSAGWRRSTGRPASPTTSWARSNGRPRSMRSTRCTAGCDELR
jgi:hypothetical protein